MTPGEAQSPSVIRMLTNSRVKAARRCGRYHQLKYEQGVDTMHRAEPLIFGDVIHQALEPWWLWWMKHDDADQGALEAALAGLARVPDIDVYQRAKAEAMIEGYHAFYAPEMREGTWSVIGVEYEFVTPLVDPHTGARARGWVQGGKLDVLAIYNPDNRRHLIEHKSSAEDLTVGAVYWRRLRMDSQVSSYFEGAAALGEPVDECTYDVLRKPDQRRLKATPEQDRKYTKEKSKACPDCNEGCSKCGMTGRIVTEPPRLYAGQRERDETAAEYRDRCREAISENPSAFYRRERIVRLEEDIRQHRLDVWAMAQLIEQRHADGFSPRNPDACESYGRTCEYFSLCDGTASLDGQERLYQIRKTVHPELSFIEEPRERAVAAPEEDFTDDRE